MRQRRLAVCIALAAALPYLPLATDYFIQDDFGVVALLSQRPVTYFPRWFVMPWTEDIWGYVPDEIRPFPALTYSIAGLFGAASPVANHLINVAFHAVNALLVFGIASQAAGLGAIAATLAALLFAWLPMQGESVAWITGRVDSMPACFYLASFLLFVRWRNGGRRSSYVGSLVCCFIALFSKQNGVTLPASIIAYDLIIRRETIVQPMRSAAVYLPYAVMVIGYLVLRWFIFGEVARESMLRRDILRQAVLDLSLHLKRMALGVGAGSISGADAALIVGGAALVVAALAFLSRQHRPAAAWRSALYFVIVWIAIGAAPTLVAGYASPRHMYLASAGWAIGIAIAFQTLWTVSWRPLRWIAAAAATVLLVAYAMQMYSGIRQWHVRALLSERAVRDIEREALTNPPGTLLLLDIPRSSWDFAVPHALKPPFTTIDVSRRAGLIHESMLYCCGEPRWNLETHRAIRDWRTRPHRPPVIALFWDPKSAALTRVTDADDPALRSVVEILEKMSGYGAMDKAILDTFRSLVIPRARGR